MQNMNWKKTGVDEYEARNESALLLVERMDRIWWWWCVYAHDERIDGFAGTRKLAMSEAEKTLKMIPEP